MEKETTLAVIVIDGDIRKTRTKVLASLKAAGVKRYEYQSASLSTGFEATYRRAIYRANLTQRQSDEFNRELDKRNVFNVEIY